MEGSGILILSGAGTIGRLTDIQHCRATIRSTHLLCFGSVWAQSNQQHLLRRTGRLTMFQLIPQTLFEKVLESTICRRRNPGCLHMRRPQLQPAVSSLTAEQTTAGIQVVEQRAYLRQGPGVPFNSIKPNAVSNKTYFKGAIWKTNPYSKHLKHIGGSLSPG